MSADTAGVLPGGVPEENPATESCAPCGRKDLTSSEMVDTRVRGRICLRCAVDAARGLAQDLKEAVDSDSADGFCGGMDVASDLAAIVLAGAFSHTASEDVMRLPNGSVIYWLTLPLTTMSPAVIVRISTSELADLVVASASEPARQDLIESLCDV
jgi:hypothetical protein